MKIKRTQTTKRVVYLERRDDLSLEEFRQHWATNHAAIAVLLPDTISYRQNVVVSCGGVVKGGPAYRLDGIAELWFSTEDSASPGANPEVAECLIEDEQKFLSGLTGIGVHSQGPTPEWPQKLWLLGQFAPAIKLEKLQSFVNDSVARLGARGHELNTVIGGSEVLTREKLRAEPQLPEVAIAFGFEADEDIDDRITILQQAVLESSLLDRAQVFHVEEVMIM